jgi:hypothetical protein
MDIVSRITPFFNDLRDRQYKGYRKYVFTVPGTGGAESPEKEISPTEFNSILYISNTHNEFAVSFNDGDGLPQNILNDLFDTEMFPFYKFKITNLSATPLEMVVVCATQMVFNVPDTDYQRLPESKG